jgi:hypothetical protein
MGKQAKARAARRMAAREGGEARAGFDHDAIVTAAMAAAADAGWSDDVVERRCFDIDHRPDPRGAAIAFLAEVSAAADWTSDDKQSALETIRRWRSTRSSRRRWSGTRPTVPPGAPIAWRLKTLESR